MKTCKYCGSEVTQQEQIYQCDFCEMQLQAHQLQENGERQHTPFREIVNIEEIFQPAAALFSYHTYELLLLLRLVRKERVTLYNNMNIFYKARLEGSSEFEEIEREQGKEYEIYTRKAWTIENILLERLGHIPSKITDSYLIKFREHCIKPLKPMIIRRERGQQF